MNKNNPIGITLLMIAWSDTEADHQADDGKDYTANRKPGDKGPAELIKALWWGVLKPVVIAYRQNRSTVLNGSVGNYCKSNYETK